MRPSAITISWKRQPANGSPSAMKAKGPMSRSALVTIALVEDEAAAVAAGDEPLGGQPLPQVGVGEHLLVAVLGRDRRRDPEPERVEVAVEGVGLALGGAAAPRALDVDEVGALGQRVALAGRLDVARQDDRQVVLGHRDRRRRRSQWTTGIGVPQERWREIEKSLAR